MSEVRPLPLDPEPGTREPDDLSAIRRLRPPGPRRLAGVVDLARYREKVQGALLGRMAGCVLGCPVEFWSPSRMEELARENQEPFPPVHYWKSVPQPQELLHGMSPLRTYTRQGMDGVPVDDDIAYTLLGLLVVEEYGPGFSTQDVGSAWLRYLPLAYTAEEVTLRNLRQGIPAADAGATRNPYSDWIGASIRADPWGYLAPGFPELAAGMAHRDAYLSHRRQGIYGGMLFAAAIAAAFELRDPLEAIRVGLTEIPAGSELARHVRWALDEAPRITTHRQARQAVEQRFEGMAQAHTVNNACLTVFGLSIGGSDFTRVIGETVAMGMDNDCTAATAGSIVGAVIGKAGIPPHWYDAFHDRIESYLVGHPRFAVSDLVERFTRQAARVLGMKPG